MQRDDCEIAEGGRVGERTKVENKISVLVRNKTFLLMAGGAVGTYARHYIGKGVVTPGLLLLVGGAVGTYLRYFVGRWFNSQRWGQTFPYGTLFINLTGSFILAGAALILVERLPPAHENWYLLIGTGFCGGYTTFSTFAWETFRLIRDGSWWYGLANVLGSVVGGFLGVLLGVALAGLVAPHTQPSLQSFPGSTLFINVTGSFILAVAAVIFLERLPPEYQDWYLLVGTGFCGGFTTFSTFEWETFKLVRDDSWWYAWANVAGSVLAGFIAVLLGVRLISLALPRKLG
jgi:CrcB protein